MFDYLEKLRQKSPALRKLIAFSLSFLVAGIIFIFWILVAMPSIWQDKNISDRVSSEQPSPVSSLSQIFSQGASVLNEQINQIKNLGGIFASTTSNNVANTVSNDDTKSTEPSQSSGLIIEATTTNYIAPGSQ